MTGQYQWHGMQRFPVVAGAEAAVTNPEVDGLVVRSATLVVTYPGGRERRVPLSTPARVSGAYRWCARFNAACGRSLWAWVL